MKCTIFRLVFDTQRRAGQAGQMSRISRVPPHFAVLKEITAMLKQYGAFIQRYSATYKEANIAGPPNL